jgi:hypothetical protein
MRVKVPWVDALAQSQQQAGQATVQNGEPVKPDLTPRRMSDSYFAAVRRFLLTLHDFLLIRHARRSLLLKISGCWMNT